MKMPIAAILLSVLLVQTAVFAADATTQMPQHMQGMQKMMDDIRTEQDPDKRAALMRQHMQSMRQGMQMMGRGNAGAARPMNTEERMQGMERRMETMQMMMEQMMQHQEAETDAPVHEHDQ
jgi:protein CpxP